jgi:hypothetical protein
MIKSFPGCNSIAEIFIGAARNRSSWVQTAEDWESSMGSVKTWLLDQPEPAAQHAERAGKMYLYDLI